MDLLNNEYFHCMCVKTIVGCAGWKIHFIAMVWIVELFQILFVYIQIIAFVFGRHTRSAITVHPALFTFGALCVQGFPGASILPAHKLLRNVLPVWNDERFGGTTFYAIRSLCGCVLRWMLCVYEAHKGEVIDVGEMDIATKQGVESVEDPYRTGVNCLLNT